jgi:hypothetical protein
MSISLRSAAWPKDVRPPQQTVRRNQAEPAAAPSKGRRNEVIDVLRGYCIVMMIASHSAPDSFVNGGAHFLRFVSGAEGFVFLSGLVLGMVYRRKLDAAPARDSYRAIWRRAGMLWAAHCVLVVTALTANRLWFHYGDLPDPFAVGIPKLLWLTATLQLQPGHGLNVLPLYVFLLGAAPLAFEMLRRGKSLLLAALSSGVFLYSQYEPGLGSWAHALSGGEAFPIPAWQVLFIAGLSAGFHRGLIQSTVLARYRSWLRWCLGLAVALVAFAVVIQSAQFQFYDHAAWDSILWERHPLRAGRVVYFLLSVSAFYLLAQAWWSRKWLPRMPLDVLATLGRNSLYAFLLHILFGFVAAQFPVTLDQWLAIELVPISIIATIYLMARYQVARRWIPN